MRSEKYRLIQEEGFTRKESDKEFHELLHKYSTAYSPLYKTYVGIISVYGIVGDEKIRARLAGAPEGEYITFRPSELTDYCL